jgi:hypothetical protein
LFFVRNVECVSRFGRGEQGAGVKALVGLKDQIQCLQQDKDEAEQEVCVCLLLQHLLQSCSRGGRGIVLQEQEVV